MSIFNFWHNPNKQENATKQKKRVPTINKCEDLVVNKELTYGLYHNQYTGTKLAGALAYAPIAVPVAFMGVPSVMCENDITQERLTKLVDEFFLMMQQIHTESHRDGTVWVFPFYSPTDKELHWEAIPDESVSFVKDIDTNVLISVTTKEMLTVTTTAAGDKISTTRTRVFTKTKIVETYNGETLPSSIHNRSRVNIAGILPIPFSNNPDLNEVRGHSDYERIVPDLKDYHDIDFARSTILAKFNPKMVVSMPNGNVTTFLANNGYKNISEMDISSIDLLMLTGADDKVDFVFPSAEVNSAYTEALDTKFKKIVEGSACPEIVYGLKTTGNSNSAEESMSTLLNYVKTKQDQKTTKYYKLFAASLKILSIAEMTRYETTNIYVEWGKLDGISMDVKAKILSNFASSLSSLVDSSAATKKQIYKIWKLYYPEETEDTIEEYVAGINQMAQHKALKDAKFEDIKDINSNNNTDTEGVDMDKMPKGKE